MATKRQFLVQFEMPQGARGSNVGLLLEQLRYAGLLVYSDRLLEGQQGYVVGLTPPKNVDQVVWCDMLSSRMRSFGLKAEVVTK